VFTRTPARRGVAHDGLEPIDGRVPRELGRRATHASAIRARRASSVAS
jgi:hypothetical protein